MRSIISTPIPAAPSMPAGYNDPASDFHIPEELRPYYAEAEPTRDHGATLKDSLRAIALALASTQARSELGAAPAPGQYESPMQADQRREHSRRLEQRVREIADHLENTEHGRLLGIDEHQLRLAAAHRARAKADEAARTRRFAEARGTCPVCNTYAPDRIGIPVLRELAGKRFTSCDACYAVALQHLASATGDERFLDHNQTRAQLVAETLKGA
jgi:hypothetical protein